MICKNCGAHFDDQLPKCPYCGQFSYTGAQKEYMNRLDDLKKDLKELNETVPEMYAGELKRQVKQTRKIILIILGIVGILALLLFGSMFFAESLYKNDAKAALLFTKEAFPIADEYYQSGDYEGLLKFYQTSIEENENASFYSWEHYPFLMCYENYTFFKHAASLMGTENFSEFYMTELFYCCISNRYYQNDYKMNEEDQQLISSFEDEMLKSIDHFGLTDDEKKEFEELLNSTDYPSWDTIEKFAHKVYKRMF